VSNCVERAFEAASAGLHGYLQLALVDVDAGLRKVVASEASLADAYVAAHRVHALLVAAASVLDLLALVDVDAAAIPYESGAVRALLVR